jgi:SNF family Na+-dependent transporter
MTTHHYKNKKTALLHLDFGHLHTAFFFEAAISAAVIVISIVITDYVTRYLEEHHNMSRWRIYLLNFVLSFLAILFLLYMSLFLFGYGDAIMVR